MPTTMLAPEEVEAIRARQPFEGIYLVGSITEGGTYLLSNHGKWNDNGKPRDLIAVLPADIGKGRVIPLWITVNPDLVTELEAALA